ncbi:MAG: MFS transporter [Rhodobacteraceae bacterium]|jgi:MFS family permease|nr:MFS transporter [Paracoccaceae bacterium]
MPLSIDRTPTPNLRGFALLAGLEAGVRGMLISVMPLVVYRALGDAALASQLYFAVGAVSMLAGFMVPWLTRFVPRRWMYSGGVGLYLLGASLAVAGGPTLTALALLSNAIGTATIFVCFNAYILDYVARNDLGRSQSTQMFYAATAWTTGPVAGVWLLGVWQPLPFLLAGGFAVALLVAFWRLRLGNGKEIQRARGPAPNPIAYLGHFMRQPRLAAGWLFAVVRSCGWWVYVVYLPIFCIEAGLGDKVGGTMLSASNMLLFSAPLMLRLVYRFRVRTAVVGAFLVGGLAFALAYPASAWPWATVALLVAASVCLVMLDVAGGLPFLMAVKPSERTEMAAVYSSFRDVSGILTPGVAWLVLLVLPVAGIFAACGAAMLATGAVATRLHPRLGAARPSHGRAPRVAAE